tara:strand:- start:52463 stop:54367 length:1905 start_codon:yes stop_codon:yes gene_type:complete
MTISAKVIAHSKSSVDGKEIITFELVYPRFIHGEIMTHRMFSRNAASSRAIPVQKMIDMVRALPAKPVHWGKNQPGMQAKEEVSNWDAFGQGEYQWNGAAFDASTRAETLNNQGYHKQIVNRILEPFQWMKTVVTATEWENFFWLRNHCYSEDTEVLTSDGWKLIKDVKVGETVKSLNLESRGLENARVADTIGWESEGTAIKFEGNSVDLLVSDLHRMVVLENGQINFKYAKDLVGTNPTVVKSCKVEGFDNQSLQYKEGKFLGFYLGNGWKYKSEASGNSGVVVCKGDKHGYDVITEISCIANTLFSGKGVSTYEKDGVHHCKVDGKSVYEKFKLYGNATEKDIPAWVWESDISLKRGVFDGMLLADSNILQQAGGLKYYTSSRKMADSFQRLCLEVGASGTVSIDNRVGSVSEGLDSQGSPYKIETKSIGYRVSVNFHRNTPKLKKQPEVVDYKGMFVCLTLDKNHTLYVRRNGKVMWSGNCDAQPEIKRLAEVMLEAKEQSEPVTLSPGDWHVPYFGGEGVGYWLKGCGIPLEDALAISASCCAQVSYRLLDNTLEKARMIYQRLVGSEPVHASPFEHAATPMSLDVSFDVKGVTALHKTLGWMSGNFSQWIQYRQLLDNHTYYGNEERY